MSSHSELAKEVTGANVPSAPSDDSLACREVVAELGRLRETMVAMQSQLAEMQRHLARNQPERNVDKPRPKLEILPISDINDARVTHADSVLEAKSQASCLQTFPNIEVSVCSSKLWPKGLLTSGLQVHFQPTVEQDTYRGLAVSVFSIALKAGTWRWTVKRIIPEFVVLHLALKKSLLLGQC